MWSTTQRKRCFPCNAGDACSCLAAASSCSLPITTHPSQSSPPLLFPRHGWLSLA